MQLKLKVPRPHLHSNGQATLTCPECGEDLRPDDHFCRACGHAAPSSSSVDRPEPAPEDLETSTHELVLPPGLVRRRGNGNGRAGTSLDGVAGPGRAEQPPANLTRRTRLASWFRHHRLIAILAGALFLVAVATAGYLIFRPADPTPQRVQIALSSGAASVNDATGAAANATLLTDIRAAGATSQSDLAKVNNQLSDVSTISSERYRTTASSLLSADQAYLRKLSLLATLNDNNLDHWARIKQGLLRTSSRIGQVAPEARALDLPRGAPIVPSGAAVASMITTLDKRIAHANRELTAWRNKVAVVTASKRNDLAALTDYAGTMRGYMSQYDQLRTETDQWTNTVDSQGATFDEAYQFLGDQLAARQNLQSSIRSLSAPPGLQGAQSQIQSVLGKAVQAMANAYTGILTYEFDETYSDYRQTPGWQQFQSASSEISSEYSSARSTWEGAVSSREAAVRSRPVPQRPAV